MSAMSKKCKVVLYSSSMSKLHKNILVSSIVAISLAMLCTISSSCTIRYGERDSKNANEIINDFITDYDKINSINSSNEFTKKWIVSHSNPDGSNKALPNESEVLSMSKFIMDGYEFNKYGFFLDESRRVEFKFLNENEKYIVISDRLRNNERIIFYYSRGDCAWKMFGP